MDFLIQPMIAALTLIKNVMGSYGLAIIAFTVLMRLILWPLNTKQTVSMKAMQELQPKMKDIQEKHKDNPTLMQQEIMKLYSSNKFNPLAGCLPMLLQIPIFIGLYSALSSPDFMALAGQEKFTFVQHLHNTWRSEGGTPYDGTMAVSSNHKQFDAGKYLKVYFKGNAEPEMLPIKELRMNDSKKLLNIQPKPLIVGKPLRISISQSDLGFDDTYMENVVRLEASMVNMATKEIESVKLVPEEGKSRFGTELPTTKSSTTYHFDVLGLIVVYGFLSWAYQKSMTLMSGANAGAGAMAGPQAMLSKFMPILFAVLMLIIQIPAGVLLYLNTTMVMMLIQNLYLWKKDQNTPQPVTAPNSEIVDIK
jgi:YidC/Oxa1 family membrane protein insertase